MGETPYSEVYACAMVKSVRFANLVFVDGVPARARAAENADNLQPVEERDVKVKLVLFADVAARTRDGVNIYIGRDVGAREAVVWVVVVGSPSRVHDLDAEPVLVDDVDARARAIK